MEQSLRNWIKVIQINNGFQFYIMDLSYCSRVYGNHHIIINKSSPRDCKFSQAAYPMYISYTFKMRLFSFSIGGPNFVTPGDLGNYRSQTQNVNVSEILNVSETLLFCWHIQIFYLLNFNLFYLFIGLV